ncbi:MAG: glycoside hydrolase family 97 protein [Carboxylicivirga sp.]|jgi:alpha-glucosidase|nr:glycoside hydrolase family 97 protein [Carboxylicivirga sp.]
MKSSTLIFLTVVIGFALNANLSAQNKFELQSLNKKDKVIIGSDELGWYYTYLKGEDVAIGKSRLGINLEDELISDLKVVNTTLDKQESNWKPKWGMQKIIPDNYKELTITLENEDNSISMGLIFRMYNEGLAFKYTFCITKPSSFVIKNELTEFKVSEDSKCWVLIHPWGKKYKADVPVKEVENASLPILSKSKKGKYVFITEAELYNYGSLHVTSNDKGVLNANIMGDVSFKGQTESPWRVIMSADSPSYFIEKGYLIQNLNKPSKIEDTSWIKPGISNWDWRVRGAIEDGFTYGLNTESLLRLLNATAELGLPYFMIDAGWYGVEHEKESDPFTAIPEVDLQKILSQARQKNIGIWLYVNRKAFENYDFDKLLATYKSWGVVGVKFGFLKKKNQKSVKLLQDVLETCAKHQIMFDCHEAVIPSGIERTWPNFLTREYNHSLEDGRYIASPTDHTITPFLNNVAGPIDVTPGFFDIDKITERKYVREPLKSTVVAQAAMCLTYFSPLLCLPDIPQAYQRKNDLFQFIKSLPLSYDESKVLVGDIGKNYVVARRKGKKWWIAGVCNEEGSRFKLPLDFLEKGNYRMHLFTDGKTSSWQNDRESYQAIQKTIRSYDSLDLIMAPGGGVCIMLELL